MRAELKEKAQQQALLAGQLAKAQARLRETPIGRLRNWCIDICKNI